MQMVFVQRPRFMLFGIMALAGYLQRHGHTAAVVITSAEADWCATVRALQPEIIGCTALSNDHGWLQETCRELQEQFPAIPVVVGGVHTLFYDALITWPGITYVCTGEGEQTLVALLDRLAAGASPVAIPGLSLKMPEGIRRNPPTSPLADLAEIPEDRELYWQRYPVFRRDPLLQVLGSRGCPGRCSFCVNGLSGCRSGEVLPYRRKTAERLVAEIVALRQKMPHVSGVSLVDDLPWRGEADILDFTARYRAQVGLPLIANILPQQLTEAAAAALAAAGCRILQVAPETGNEQHRRETLGKDIPSSAFVRMAATAHRHGIKVYAAALFGYPGQTAADALTTIALNQRMRTDYPAKSYLIPYPGLPIHAQAETAGLLPPGFSFATLPRSYYQRCLVRIADAQVVEKLFDWYYFLVRCPLLFHLVRHRPGLLRLVPGSRLAHYAGMFFWFKGWKQLSAWETLRYLWRFREDR